MCAWLAPLLYHQTSVHEERALRVLKEGCIGRLGELVDPGHPDDRSSVTMEIAVAQGFRHAANLRGDPSVVHSGQSDPHQVKRAVLVEQAERALAHSSFWYAQLALVQALTLWSSSDERRRALGHGSDPRGEVDYWLNLAGSRCFRARDPHQAGGVHPFVVAAGEMAVLAMTTGRPEQFLWVDESHVLGHVGSTRRSDVPSQQSKWILPSAGWASLHPAALRIAADVLTMLNLADRGDLPKDREARLDRTDRTDLPPCFTEDRAYLDVTRTVGSAAVSEPGTNCADECEFRLCPYPPVGSISYRTELSEALCRNLAGDADIMVPWQKRLTPAQRAQFWTHMSRRSRPRPAAE